MPGERELNAWFCREILPHERALTSYLHKNWKVAEDVRELRQAIYEKVLVGVRGARPLHPRAFLFAVARNHLVSQARREAIVDLELVAEADSLLAIPDFAGTERGLGARDELRRAQEGLDRLPPRVREAVWLRKVEGLTTIETAQRMGVSPQTVEKQITQGMRALTDFMLGGDGRIDRSADKAFRARRGRQ